MEAGLLSKLKIGAIIQGRVQSTRLPAKILLPLPFGSSKLLLTWPIKEIKKSALVNSIVLATSDQSENKILEEFANNLGIGYYEGSEEDVLSRYCEISKARGLDIGIRLTGDNPIIDIKLVDELILTHLQNENDFTYSLNLPVGMNMEIFKPSALLAFSNNLDLTDEDREHVTLYFKKTNTFKVMAYNFPGILSNSKIRLTVDYPGDYAALNIVLQLAEITGLNGMNLINHINENYEWVWEINNDNYQRKQFFDLKEELHFAIDLLKKYDLRYSQEMLTKAFDE